MMFREKLKLSGRSGERGFTLIELIVVIIILGILAATALPRFANLQTQARVAKLNGALGAMKGAAALAHAACLARVPPCTAQPGSGTIDMEGVNVTMVNTYPTADAAGILMAAGLDTTSNSSDGYIHEGGGAAAGSVLKFMVQGNDQNNCFFNYTAPTGVNRAPEFGNPAGIGGSTTGC